MIEKVGILGSGESGLGAAVLAKKLNTDVFVSDAGSIPNSTKTYFEENGIAYEEKQHSLEQLLEADIIVKSPGIPDEAVIIKSLTEKNIPIISEIEFGAMFTDASLIAITGSNGKTTVANMTYQLLEGELPNTKLAGNIGISFAKSVAEDDAKNYVLEVSSFQLDGIKTFKPHIAILTSITPDHLDRYNYDFNLYTASKFRIAENQTENDYFIYNADEEHLSNWLKQNPIKSKCIPISTQKKLEYGTYLEDNNIIINLNEKIELMPISILETRVEHNTKNAMAASTAAHLLKIRKKTIREKLSAFQGVEHRLETVLKINNVTYINDSKATNINAAHYALKSVPANTIWIVGGVDKGNDYSELLSSVNEKVKAIICLGVDNHKIVESFCDCVDDIYETQSMEECVKIAYHLAEADDTVLLSPACASFDLFQNYEDRGNQFKEAVRNL
jgi:UDP-N-acetylmuramoylalanine--D-glutamate ligase